MARNYRSGAAWLPGGIVQQLGPLTYLVDVSEGRLWKRHVDHIKDLHARPTENETWPEPQVGGSSEATETSPSLPDLPLPVVEPTEGPTSVPVPTSPPNEAPVPESHGLPTSASSSRVIAPPSTLISAHFSCKGGTLLAGVYFSCKGYTFLATGYSSCRGYTLSCRGGVHFLHLVLGVGGSSAMNFEPKSAAHYLE